MVLMAEKGVSWKEITKELQEDRDLGVKTSIY